MASVFGPNIALTTVRPRFRLTWYGPPPPSYQSIESSVAGTTNGPLSRSPSIVGLQLHRCVAVRWERPDEKLEVRTNRTNTFSVERHMGNLFADIRYAFRPLIRKPGFAAVPILTLALGIGATTAIFTVVHAFLLRPLPFPEADRLVEV